MNQTENRNYIISYSLNGLALGFFISLLFIISGIINHSPEFSLYGAYFYLTSYPYNWIFYFIIIVSFAIIGYLLGRYFNDKQTQLIQDLGDEREKNKRVFRFTEQLRKGSFFDKEVLLSNDELSKSLINLRDELQRREKEDRLRKEEEDQRHWITEGLATFGAVLRETGNELENLSYSVVSELAKYLKSQLVGIFVINDSEPEINLLSKLELLHMEEKNLLIKNWNGEKDWLGPVFWNRKLFFLKMLQMVMLK
ncbi:MAG: hypothetical protein HC831_14880 [Chloroflexia bacterium]|nr:hypothetical protein [Chloroflexia bacterium]